MSGQQRSASKAIVVAAVIGVAAGALAYLFYTRPRWRSHVVEMGRLALDVAGNVFRHHEIE